MHPQRLYSKSSPLLNHFANAHGVRLYALAQGPHPLDDLLMGWLRLRFSDRHQLGRRNAMPGNRDAFALRHPIKERSEVGLCIKRANGVHSGLQTSLDWFDLTVPGNLS